MVASELVGETYLTTRIKSLKISIENYTQRLWTNTTRGPSSQSGDGPFVFGGMMKYTRRKLVRQGGSIGVTLPAKFLKESRLNVGDTVEMAFNDIVIAVKAAWPEERGQNETRR